MHKTVQRFCKHTESHGIVYQAVECIHVVTSEFSINLCITGHWWYGCLNKCINVGNACILEIQMCTRWNLFYIIWPPDTMYAFTCICTCCTCTQHLADHNVCAESMCHITTLLLLALFPAHQLHSWVLWINPSPILRLSPRHNVDRRFLNS